MPEIFDVARLSPLPDFYVATATTHYHPRLQVGMVVATTAPHNDAGYVTAGYVSIVTPFGQGVYMGLPVSILRPAGLEEVKKALIKSHPMGADFRPSFAVLGDYMSEYNYMMLMNKWPMIVLDQIKAIMNSFASAI